MSLPTAISFPQTDATVHRLENGLEVILRPDHSAPLVSVQAWVRTGSLFEDILLGSGVSHLVEHLVFKGAGGRGPTELAQSVQATGGYLNAYTSFDRTVYWIDTLREGFANAVDVVAALTTEADFPAGEYDREMDVIRREMDMGKDDPSRTVGQLMFSTVFRHHPYREPVIGRLELFNTITRDKALNYYRERYIPDRMFVVIVGAIEPEVALEAVQQRFGAKENRPSAPVILPEEPPQTARRDAHIEFATELTKLELAWRIPDLLHPDTPALEVLGVLLGQGRSSRLYREVRERRGLVHEIGAGAYTPTQGGIFYVSADLDPNKRMLAEEAILETITALQERGVSEADVARARRIFLADQLSSLTTMRGQASDLGSNWICAHNLDFTRQYLESVDRVTPQQVQDAARRYLVERSLSSVSVNPRGSQSSATTRQTSRRPEEVQRHIFENGLTLLVREDSRLPMVHLHASLRGGSLAESPATNGLNRLLARTIIKGAGHRSEEEIVEAIENGGGSIGADCGGSSFSVSAGVLTPEFRLGLDIWGDVLLHPWFAEDQVLSERERQLAAVKAEEDHLMVVAFRQLRRLLYGAHPFHLSRNGTTESVAGLNAEMLKEFHRHHVVAGNAVMSIFGDVRFSEVRDLVGEKLTGLPAGSRRNLENLPSPPNSAGQSADLVRNKRQAVLAVGFPTVDLTHPDRIALDVIDEACSDMASRMFNRIREELGLAYSVGCSQILGMAPGAFTFYLSTSPEQLDFAQQEMLAEIQKLAAEGLHQDEIDRAKKTWAGKQAMQHQSSGAQAQQCAIDELYGLGFDHQKRSLERAQEMTRDEINRVAAKYFGASIPVIVRAHP